MKIEPFKNAIALRLTQEQVYFTRSMSDPRYNRKVKEVIVTEPTEQDWADYREAKKAYEFLIQSPYFDDGGMYSDPRVVEPEPRREYVYAETEAEWLARCREMEEK